MGALHIQLLGDFRLRHDDTPLTGVDTPRLQSLLAYLLLHREAAQSRHHLAFLFWPDSTEAQALANLRKLLFLLRQALPEADAFLALDSQSVAWHPQSPFTLDVAEFENAIAQAQRAQASGEQVDLRAALEWAVDVYDSGGSTPAGKLLPGCYDDWILAERERLHHQFLESIDRLAGSLEQQGEYRTAISYAQRLLRHDPLHEAAYQRLMRLYGLSGDRAGVIHTYHTCTRMLQQELGVEPSLATTTLYQELLQTLDQPTNGRPGAPLSNRKPRHNLPAQLSSFIGREAEMAEIHMLLSRSRLVTMTGVGGIGKTRLAVQGAAELLGFFPDGVWLVELAAISDPAFVPNTVASLLGLPEEPGVPQLSTLCNYLRTKCLLLIMDNCEHLIEECAALAETLLRHCPDVKIIAASRQALGVTGEITFQVPTLQVPDSQQPLSSETLVARFDAVRLFTERALAVRPGFMVTRENAPAVVQICQRLDGVPLAIELAAARVRVIPVAQIAERLDDRFRLLTGGSRTAMPRQQTLQALIDWSYNLLSDAERVLLRRLSVFAGGWTLEAAGAVYGVEGSNQGYACAQGGKAPDDSDPSFEILDLLTQLVDKSLVIAEEQEGEARYRMLETIHQYARDKLVETGEREQTRDRHLAYFLKLAKIAEEKFRGAGQLTWMKRVRRELENFRLAIRWSLETLHDNTIPQMGLKLSSALFYYWTNTGSWREGSTYLENFLAHPVAQGQTAARAEALLRASWLGLMGRDTSYLEESIALSRLLGEKECLAWALSCLANSEVQFHNNFGRAEHLLAESSNLFQELGDRWGLAWILSHQGDLYMHMRYYKQARAYQEEATAVFKSLGDRINYGTAISHVGMIDMWEGDYAAARAHFGERADISREGGGANNLRNSLLFLSAATLYQGDYAGVLALFGQNQALIQQIGSAMRAVEIGYAAEAYRLLGKPQEALLYFWEGVRAGAPQRDKTDKSAFALCLRGLAGLALATGNGARAARLLATAERCHPIEEGGQLPSATITYEQDLADTRAQLGDAAFESAWAEGQAMPLEQAVAYALEEVTDG